MDPLTPAKHLPIRRPARSQSGRLLASAVALLACQALAATSTALTDPAAPVVPALRSLDKALSGEISTGDRNLDLLLDAQRRGVGTLDDAPTPGRTPERGRSGRLAGQPLPEPQRPADPYRQPQVPLLAVPSAAPFAGLTTSPLGQVLPSASPAPSPRLGRDWNGSGGAGQAAATAGQRGAGPPNLLLRDLIQDGLAFIKDHLLAILGTWAAIAALVFGLRAYSRRI